MTKTPEQWMKALAEADQWDDRLKCEIERFNIVKAIQRESRDAGIRIGMDDAIAETRSIMNKPGTYDSAPVYVLEKLLENLEQLKEKKA